MASLLGRDLFFKNLTWSGPAPTSYSAHFSLNRIIPGVDNFRYDVHLSPIFRETASRIIFHLILKATRADEDLDINFSWVKEKEEFVTLCRDVMLIAIKRAKMGDGEIQIDYLAQMAVCKFIIQEINLQFDEVLARLGNQVWEYESTEEDDLVLQTMRLKERIREIRHKRSSIVGEANSEMFQNLLEAQKYLKERREANYGSKSLLKDDIFLNPILHIDNQTDDVFMLENYVLLGHRNDDPDKYDAILELIGDLFGKIEFGREKETETAIEDDYSSPDESDAERRSELRSRRIDGWIREVGNVDFLMDYMRTRMLIEEKVNKLNQDERVLENLGTVEAEQTRILNHFYDRFRQRKIIQRLVAAFEMKAIYAEYCPPLVPHQLLHYFITGEGRKSVLAYLKRLNDYYGRSISPANLKKTAIKIGRLNTRTKHKYFLAYLRGFFRYHRDQQNYKLLKQAFDRVNLVADDKTAALSRTNNTLYEFLLPHEQVFELFTKPVTSHVIIKADVRGATDITRQLYESGLNPASYFSLNFFNPISEIVSQYGALKVFIEGDAIILAILERKDDETGKYCVSRACGLAINMLHIINRYNAKSRKYKLPILELGVGITYHNAPPAYLLDGKKRIMISPAINLADRLSSCDRTLRRVLDRGGRPFNLYVFQSQVASGAKLSDDEIIMRFNVNGIELNEAGFKKLSREIDLRTINCMIPTIQQEPVIIHTAKFPLVTGSFQRLIIREQWVQELNPENYKPAGIVNRKYFEVCTNEALRKYLEKEEGGEQG